MKNIMGTMCSCSCFGFAVGSGTEASRSMVLPESESLCSKFKRRIKRKHKKPSSKPTPLSNYDVKISPNRVVSGKSESLVGIVSISPDGELIPVILSPVTEVISDERQQAKKKKKKQPLGLDSAEIKVKSHDAADISVKSPDSEVCTAELTPKQISGEEKEVTVRKLDRRSQVRLAEACRFLTNPNSRNEGKVSQNPNRGHDTKMSVIEQPKAQTMQQEKEIADSILGPIDRLYSKSSRTTAELDSKSCKLLKSHASAPNSPFRSREIKSAPLFSSSSCLQFPRPNMATSMQNSPTSNPQPKKLNVLAAVAKREGTITGSLANVAGEGEGYGSAMNAWVLIIIFGCLVMFSDRLLAIVCASLWWYLLPSLLKKK